MDGLCFAEICEGLVFCEYSTITKGYSGTLLSVAARPFSVVVLLDVLGPIREFHTALFQTQKVYL